MWKCCLHEYKFKKFGADELHNLKKKYDFVYCKGIEHIPNWKNVVKNILSVSRKKTFVYIKTRPFFSYLGPHRFATTAIPWGHALLNDKEYVRYVNQFHKERKTIAKYIMVQTGWLIVVWYILVFD